MWYRNDEKSPKSAEYDASFVCLFEIEVVVRNEGEEGGVGCE